jgi:hypothetical protein
MKRAWHRWSIALLLSGGVGVYAIRVARTAAYSTPVPMSGAPGVDIRGASVATRFAPPAGFVREPAGTRSFASFLRALPLEPDGSPVRLYDGSLGRRQDHHAAVVALEVGPRDLQQCADSILRLRAEYLFASDRADEIAFHFTSGFVCSFARWSRGDRPRVVGEAVDWVGGARPDASMASLARYLDVVYTYAGTRSLPFDLERAGEGAGVEPGDVYLRPGSPGHAMIVVDSARSGASRCILLAQGYMPAQEIHIVRNLEDPSFGAWFVVGRGPKLVTPEWTCSWGDRWRFREPR